MPKELTQKDVREFRRRLCDSFRRLLSERGYSAVTMRALAEDIGCSPMTPYRYFKDKDEILAAVRADGFRRLLDSIEEGTEGQTDPVERTRHACELYLRFALDEPDTYRLMYFNLGLDTPETEELAEQIERARRMITGLAQAVPEVEKSPFRAAAAAQAFWAALHGVISVHLADGFDEETTVDEVVAVLMAVLTEGGRALFHLPDQEPNP